MASYILRLRDDEQALWAEVKARSAAEGIPLRAIIIRLLAAYAAGKLEYHRHAHRSVLG